MSDQKIKAAAGKPPMALIPARALIGAARVFAYGAKRYAPGNFLVATLSDGAGSRYISAAMRHLSEMQLPNGLHTAESLATRDEESGLPHIDHVLCGLMMLRSILTKDGALAADPGVGKDPIPVAALSSPEPEIGRLDFVAHDAPRHEIGLCDCRDCETLRMSTVLPLAHLSEASRSEFGKSVRELAAMRDDIPKERRREAMSAPLCELPLAEKCPVCGHLNCLWFKTQGGKP